LLAADLLAGDRPLQLVREVGLRGRPQALRLVPGPLGLVGPARVLDRQVRRVTCGLGLALGLRLAADRVALDLRRAWPAPRLEVALLVGHVADGQRDGLEPHALEARAA